MPTYGGIREVDGNKMKHWLKEKHSNELFSVVYCAETDEGCTKCLSVNQYVKRAGAWSRNIIAQENDHNTAKDEFLAFINDDNAHVLSWLLQDDVEQRVVDEILHWNNE